MSEENRQLTPEELTQIANQLNAQVSQLNLWNESENKAQR